MSDPDSCWVCRESHRRATLDFMQSTRKQPLDPGGSRLGMLTRLCHHRSSTITKAMVHLIALYRGTARQLRILYGLRSCTSFKAYHRTVYIELPNATSVEALLPVPADDKTLASVS